MFLCLLFAVANETRLYNILISFYIWCNGVFALVQINFMQCIEKTYIKLWAISLHSMRVWNHKTARYCWLIFARMWKLSAAFYNIQYAFVQKLIINIFAVIKLTIRNCIFIANNSLKRIFFLILWKKVYSCFSI